MNKNAMPVKKDCVNCQSIDCSVNEQKHFDGLQVTVVEQHDQALVDARMLGVHSSTESRKTTDNSQHISTHKDSDYCLKRMMATSAKICTFVQRRLPRAKTW
jgi:hypothetical protein